MGFGIKRRIEIVRNMAKYTSLLVKSNYNEFLDILLLCHSLEKGMGVEDAKRGFGIGKAEKLIELLKAKKSQGKINCYEYQEALAILDAYFSFHEMSGYDISNLKSKAKDLFDSQDNPFKGGYQYIEKSNLTIGQNIDFKSFVNSRHSMRTFASEPIDNDLINKVVNLAKKAPSACNREPWKFHYSLDREFNKRIGQLLPKQSFLDGVPYFGVVTVDRGLATAGEFNQWYINGGIFLSFLILAFHHYGVGSCIFQFPVLWETRGEVYEVLNIPKNEEIISFVGYGLYPDKAKCIFADRRPNDNIAIEFKEDDLTIRKSNVND